MPNIQIDQDEYHVIFEKLKGRVIWRNDGTSSMVTGNHEDYGAVILYSEDGAFSVEADEVNSIRPRDTPVA